MKSFYLVFISCFLLNVLSAETTTLSGKITDAQSNEELIGTNILIYQAGKLITGVPTDFDGRYSVYLSSGIYDVEFSYIGYETNQIVGVEVIAGEDKKLNVALLAGVNMPEIVVFDYKVPIVTNCGTSCHFLVRPEEVESVVEPDSLKELILPSFLCYPNPTTDYLFVKVEGEINQLIIRSINGQEIKRTRWGLARNTKISVSNLAAGTYLIQAEIGNQTLTEKFIVIHP